MQWRGGLSITGGANTLIAAPPPPPPPPPTYTHAAFLSEFLISLSTNMHTLGLGPSIVIISSAVSFRNDIVDYLDTSVNGYDNTLVSPPAFYVDGQETRLPPPPQPHKRRHGGASASIGVWGGAPSALHFLSPKTDIA